MKLIMQLGALLVGFIFIVRETFSPILLAREDGRAFINPAQNSRQVFTTAFTRPLRFIFRTRLLPLFTLYTSILNSYLVILLATLGTKFETVYNFSPGASGLAYLGMAVGFVLSELTLGYLSDAYASRQTRRRPNGIAKPEDRLPPLTFGALLLPGALLLFGWTLERQIMWLVPIVGSGLIAFATMYSYIPVQIYTMEVYLLYTVSATGAMSIIRTAIAALAPLGANPLYSSLGYGWGYTLLAGLALPFVLFGLALVRYGESIRKLDSAVE